MKKIFILTLTIFLLTSCGSEEVVVNEKSNKKDFKLEVKNFSHFSGETLLNKSGKINSSQEINISSQISGRVLSILVREGDLVQKGSVLAQIGDTVSNYGLNLQSAKNNLERTEISYDSTKINLDKNVFDAEQNIKRTKSNLEALIKDSFENVTKAKNDLNNTDITQVDSKGSLDIKKTENNILKAELDYDNFLISNNESLEGYYSGVEKEYNSLLLTLDDIVDFGDNLFGITDLNKDNNNSFDTYFGAKDTSQKSNTKQLLKDIIIYRSGEFTSINFSNIDSQEDLEKSLIIISSGYEKVQKFLNAVEITLNNSIESVGSFSETDIATYVGSVNGYQASVQANHSVYISFRTTVSSFLRTYVNNQISRKQSINLMKEDLEILKKTLNVNKSNAEVGYNKVVINTNDAILNLEIQLASAENTLKNTKETRSVTLRSLQNSIDEARIGYKKSLIQYEKLTIKSPIDGVISEISIDEGQNVNSGMALFSVVNNDENEVQVSFSKDELSYVEDGMEVFVEYNNMSYTGSIYSISQTADQNLKYKSTIQLNDNVNLIGNIVSIHIPIKINNKLLPLNIVKVLNNNEGEISILKNNLIDRTRVQLGTIYGDSIEILSGVDDDTQIILSYIDNFDPNKFTLSIINITDIPQESSQEEGADNK
ncbi:MAG: HlyD family efflux transporter periplasmic adaptor subunit [Candidatus Gracilibacteria bacterium]|nr:HlyD family efflux transporter periplasmic adaptor subunit [Candidatus Gracilibacteria bacterium]